MYVVRNVRGAKCTWYKMYRFIEWVEMYVGRNVQTPQNCAMGKKVVISCTCKLKNKAIETFSRQLQATTISIRDFSVNPKLTSVFKSNCLGFGSIFSNNYFCIHVPEMKGYTVVTFL